MKRVILTSILGGSEKIDGKWVDVTDPSLLDTFGVAEYTSVIGDPYMPVLFK
ncbi:MAG: hypothetical protein IK020_12985 [Clostridiales bacterium]|nr:hypothetical protein [Clostridiales bacterium]